MSSTLTSAGGSEVDWRDIIGMPKAPTTTVRPAAAWYPDPYGTAELRYWDGYQWTPHTWPAPQPEPTPELVIEIRPMTGEVPVLDLSPQQPPPLEVLLPRVELPPVPVAIPTLRELVESLRREAPRHPLDEQVEVVGETYYVKGIKNVLP